MTAATAVGVTHPPSTSAPTLPAVLAAVSVGSAVLLVVASAAGLDSLQAGAALVFMVVGLGSAPWHLTDRPGTLDRLALTALTGLSAVVLIPTLAVLLGQWHPHVLIFLVGIPALGLHGWVLRPSQSARLVEAGRPAYRRLLTRPASELAAPLLAVIGFGLAVAAALTHRGIDPDFYGFLRDIGPLWYVGVGLIVIALLLLGDSAAGSAWLCVTLLVLVMTLTPGLVYDGPRSAATGKHVDLVEQIRQTGAIASSVAVYDAWPGFFAALAWVCDVAGIRDLYHLAQYWPALLGLVRVLGLGYLIRQVTPTARWTWLGVALAALADPLGADYFSPQSLGFVLGLLIFGLALQTRLTGPWVRLALVAAGTALTVEHQLSPYIVGGVLVLLAVLRQVKAFAAAAVMVPAVAWTVGHRDSLVGYFSLDGIGSLANFRPPATVGTVGLERLPVVGYSVRALLLGLLVVGLLALVTVVRERRSLRTWALAAAPSVGLAAVAVNPYGNEGIFRAVLFAVPWLAALAARGLAGLRRPAFLLVPGLGVLLGTFLIASFALDPVYVIRPADRAAIDVFYRAAAAEPTRGAYLLSLGDGDLPTLPPDVEGRVLAIQRQDLDVPVRQEDPAQPDRDVERITDAFRDYTDEPNRDVDLYAIWSPLSSRYDRAYALQTEDQFAALQEAFRRSPFWGVVFDEQGSVLFKFVPSAATAQSVGGDT